MSLKSDRRRWQAIGGVLCLVLGLVLAPLPSHGQAPPAPQPDYHPSLGDLMTMAVQPRHAKLGLAGAERNWAYAAYESSELRNAFNRIARTIPAYRSVDLAGMFASTVKDPLDRIDTAIKAKDRGGLTTAYADLTQACNLCHQGMEHGYVVIQAPKAAAFPDQVFTAQVLTTPAR